MSNADFLCNNAALSGSCDYQRMYNFNNYPTNNGGVVNASLFNTGAVFGNTGINFMQNGCGLNFNNNYSNPYMNTNATTTTDANGITTTTYSQTPDKLMMGIGALGAICNGIGSVMIAKDQAQVQQQQQLQQYQAYQQQAAQLAQQQQKEQAANSMQSMFQMMMMMKQFDATSSS